MKLYSEYLVYFNICVCKHVNFGKIKALDKIRYWSSDRVLIKYWSSIDRVLIEYWSSIKDDKGTEFL